jgi:hypothetical protein
MRCTEEEAVKKRCCVYGCGREDGGTMHKRGESYCVGTQCMAWTWVLVRSEFTGGEKIGRCGRVNDGSK